jgi:DNA-binding beta-propeller fold protein YncE
MTDNSHHAPRYSADPNWAQLPPGYSWSEVAGVACDRNDRVFVFARSEHPVMVFQRDGTFVASWGEGVFARPHGIAIDGEGAVWCTDDLGHCVRKFTPEGRLLLTLGTPGRAADTGATSIDFRTIRHAAGPFHFPTNVAFGRRGEVYISDGYGNARVHQFDGEGRLVRSWGAPGAGPGEFHVPHGIAVDREGVVYVADRENSRIQRFTPAGEFLGEWREIARPCQLAFDPAGRVYVAELGYRAGMWPGTTPPHPNATGGRVSLVDERGQVIAQWGGGENPTAPGDFFAPHDIVFDSHGEFYLAELMYSAGANRGLVAADCHALQKFTRENE